MDCWGAKQTFNGKKKNPTNGCFLLRIVCLHSSQCWYLDLFVYHTFCSALWGSYISKIVRFTNPSCQALHLWPNTQSHTSQSPVRNYWKLEMTATYTVLERLALLPSHQLYQSWRVYFIERRAERATHVHSCQDWLQLESDLPTGSAGSSAPLLIWLGEVSLWYRMTVLHFNYQVVFENARCFFFSVSIGFSPDAFVKQTQTIWSIRIDPPNPQTLLFMCVALCFLSAILCCLVCRESPATIKCTEK